MLHRKEILPDFDYDLLEYEVAKGLFFESDIPQGYGLGSSGAVSAAVYDRYTMTNELRSLDTIRDNLSAIESFFHGKSSGVDPLTIFFYQPLLLHPQGHIELLDTMNSGILKNFYLLDTGVKRHTSPLVEAYMEMRRSSGDFLEKMQQIAEINDELIDIFLLGRKEDFEQGLRTLSKMQYDTLQMLILPDFREFWKQGIESGLYSTKINGAGAGGFLMVYFHTDDDTAIEIKKKYGLIKLWAEQ